jgi:hypothetical protein
MIAQNGIKNYTGKLKHVYKSKCEFDMQEKECEF